MWSGPALGPVWSKRRPPWTGEVCSVALVRSDSLRAYGLARQAPQSMEFSRQEYWSGLPCLGRREGHGRSEL